MYLSPSGPGPEQPRPRTCAPSSAVAAPGHATDVCLPWMRPVFGLSAATLSTSLLLSAGISFEEHSRGHRTFDSFKSSTMTSPSSYSTVCCSCKHGEYACTHMCTIMHMSMLQSHGTRNTLWVLASKRVRMPPNHCSSPSHHTSILLPTTSCPSVLLPTVTSSCVTRARAVLPFPLNPVPQLPRVGSPSSTTSSSASRPNLFCLPLPLHAPTPCTRGLPRQPSCTPRPPAELSPESLPARREDMYTQIFSPHKSRFSARACSLSCMLFCDMNEYDTSTLFYSHHLQAFPALLHTPPSTALAGRACSICQGSARKMLGGRPVRTMTRARTTASVRRCRRTLCGPSLSATMRPPNNSKRKAQLRHPYLPFAGQPPHGGTCEYTHVILYLPVHVMYATRHTAKVKCTSGIVPKNLKACKRCGWAEGFQPQCRGAQEHDSESKSTFSGEVDAESVFVSR